MRETASFKRSDSYFVDHPEMVLGDTVLESTPYGKDDITVRPIPGAELSDLLKEAVSRIQGTYQAVELPEADKGKEAETIPATPDVKNFSYAVVDGEVYFRDNSIMRHVKQIPIADYLHSLGYSPVKQQGNGLWYKSPLREEHEPSFKVNRYGRLSEQ